MGEVTSASTGHGVNSRHVTTIGGCATLSGVMARPIRVESAGAGYHVIVRGNERKANPERTGPLAGLPSTPGTPRSFPYQSGRASAVSARSEGDWPGRLRGISSHRRNPTASDDTHGYGLPTRPVAATKVAWLSRAVPNSQHGSGEPCYEDGRTARRCSRTKTLFRSQRVAQPPLEKSVHLLYDQHRGERALPIRHEQQSVAHVALYRDSQPELMARDVLPTHGCHRLEPWPFDQRWPGAHDRVPCRQK